MSPARRAALLRLAGFASSAVAIAANVSGATVDDDRVAPDRALRFPRDHGAHPGARTEWWYATGWLGAQAAPSLGFQLTFFRSRTGLGAGNSSRFAPRQLLFAHAAVTDLQAKAHHHAQRIARWSGDDTVGRVGASSVDGDVRLNDWTLKREGRDWLALLPAETFSMQVRLQPSQPLLLQGQAGFSRKGPDAEQASHYYSEPQLTAQVSVTLNGRSQPLRGRAWLDHEWSDHLLHPQAVGWDWIGMNLFDGSALTAFALRRADGSALWAGGSFRAAPRAGSAIAAARNFAPSDVQWRPGRRWRSAASNTEYPVQWTVDTPAGRFEVRALLDAQELDSRGSTGAVYWEGLSELLDEKGQPVGLGYLEMTGYQAALRMF